MNSYIKSGPHPHSQSDSREVGKPNVLWCSNQRVGTGNGWKFPPKVRRQLVEDCRGSSVLHLFGGHADFGTRLDIDAIVRPDVLGDAWLPPFARDSFDVVVLDPPYVHLPSIAKVALFRAAAWIARRRVVWFATWWVSQSPGLTPEASWLIRIGDNCHVRCLQYFTVKPDKLEPVKHFRRGPAVRYSRWLAQPQGFAFEEMPAEPICDPFASEAGRQIVQHPKKEKL